MNKDLFSKGIRQFIPKLIYSLGYGVWWTIEMFFCSAVPVVYLIFCRSIVDDQKFIINSYLIDMLLLSSSIMSSAILLFIKSFRPSNSNVRAGVFIGGFLLNLIPLSIYFFTKGENTHLSEPSRAVVCSALIIIFASIISAVAGGIEKYGAKAKTAVDLEKEGKTNEG